MIVKIHYKIMSLPKPESISATGYESDSDFISIITMKHFQTCPRITFLCHLSKIIEREGIKYYRTYWFYKCLYPSASPIFCYLK